MRGGLRGPSFNTPTSTYKENATIVPILQMRKLGHQEAKWPARVWAQRLRLGSRCLREGPSLPG